MLNRAGASIGLWTPTRFSTSDHHPLGSASFQPTSLPAHHHAWRHQQLVCENLMRDGVKGPTQVQADNIHCSSLIYQGSHRSFWSWSSMTSPFEAMLTMLLMIYLFFMYLKMATIVFSVWLGLQAFGLGLFLALLILNPADSRPDLSPMIGYLWFPLHCPSPHASPQCVLLQAFMQTLAENFSNIF